MPRAEPGPPSSIWLCAIADIADGAVTAIALPTLGSEQGILLFRRGDQCHFYWDRCPHMGVSLRWGEKILVSPDGQHLRCANHDALFRIADGRCVMGPCAGETLQAACIHIVDGQVWLGLP